MQNSRTDAAGRSRTVRSVGLALLAVSMFAAGFVLAQPQGRRAQMLAATERALAEPFIGVTTDGNVRPDVFALRSTGVSTAPVVSAAEEFLASLTDEQRERTTFPVDDVEWRKWDNRHFYQRQGVGFDEMTEQQRQSAFAMLRVSLSAKGLKTTQDIMKLNGTLAELTNRFDEYGEWLYWITIMGEPSATKPWGWQLDGHHVNVNYFVVGDQVVMTPTFMGSEPIRAESGKFAGTEVLQVEQDKGLAFMRTLTADQQAEATIRSEKGPTHNLTEAFKDNVVLDYAGIPASKLTKTQQEGLLGVISEFVGNIRDGHAAVKMQEVRDHLEETHFAWIGKTDEEAVFYYRIQSPVILIEFDHQRPIALARSQTPTRNHVHTVVRTPNGNDYGKDLLRQHYEKHHRGEASTKSQD